MSKKFTYGEVKDYIEKEGYKLISTKYVKNSENLKIICPNGHIREMSFMTFKAGGRCKICQDISSGKKRRRSEESVREYIEKENYKVIDLNYKGAHDSFVVQCPEGHTFKTCWNSFSRGRRCPYCLNHYTKSVEEVTEIFKKEDYTLVSKDYNNQDQILSIICPKGHSTEITYRKFKSGIRCKVCWNERRGTARRFSYKKVKETIEKEGFILLDKTYKNSVTPLNVICPEGHLYNVKFDLFQRGCRCPYCFGNVRKNINDIKKEFESEGYILLTKNYKSIKQKLKYICPNNHESVITFANWMKGARCQLCEWEKRRKVWSKEELENFKIYRRAVSYLSNKNYKKYKWLINPLNLKRTRGQFHLDHIFSVVDAFNNNIPVEIVANPSNLQMLSETENLVKQHNSHFTLDELLTKYLNWKLS